MSNGIIESESIAGTLTGEASLAGSASIESESIAGTLTGEASLAGSASGEASLAGSASGEGSLSGEANRAPIVYGTHNDLSGRDAEDTHPINSITALADQLNSRPSSQISDEEIEAL